MDFNHLLNHQQHQEQPSSMSAYGRGAQTAFSEAIPSQPFPFSFSTQPQLAQQDLSTRYHQDTGYSSTAYPPPPPSSDQPFASTSNFIFPLSSSPLPHYQHPQAQAQQQPLQHEQHEFFFPKPPQQQNFLFPSPSSHFPYSAYNPSASNSLPDHDRRIYRSGTTISRSPHSYLSPNNSNFVPFSSPRPFPVVSAAASVDAATTSSQSHQPTPPLQRSSRNKSVRFLPQNAVSAEQLPPSLASRPRKRVRIAPEHAAEDYDSTEDPAPPTKRLRAKSSKSSKSSKELGPLGLSNTTLWPAAKDAKLLDGIATYGLDDWDEIAKVVELAKEQCQRRWASALGHLPMEDSSKKKLQVGWTEEEDGKLLSLQAAGQGWNEIEKQLVGRSAKQARERWKRLEKSKKDGVKNLKRGFSKEEDRQLLQLKAAGNRWTEIGRHLGRPINSVHDRWNLLQRKSSGTDCGAANLDLRAGPSEESDPLSPSFTPSSQINATTSTGSDDPPPSFDEPLPFFDDSILQFGLIPDNSGFSPSFDLPLSPIFASSTFSSFAQPAPQSSDNFHFNKFIEFGIDKNDEGTGEMSFAGFGGSISNCGDTGREEDLGGYENTDWSAMSREDVENDLMVWDGLTRVGDVGVGESRDGTMGAAAVFDLGENEVEMMDWRASQEEVGEEVPEFGGSREKEELEGEGGIEEGEIPMRSIDEKVNGGDGHEIGTVGEEDDLEELEEGEIREGTVDLSDAREVETDSALSDVALSMPPFGSLPGFSQPGSSVPSGQGSFSYDSNGPRSSGRSAYSSPPPPRAAVSHLGSSPLGDQDPICGGPQLGQQQQIILERAVRGQEDIAPGPAGPGYGDGFAPLWSMRSPLLDEFRSSNRPWELADLNGHVVEFAGDPLGSRHIEQKLENATDAEKTMIFNEILPNMLRLSTDVFASHVIQKFFEKGSQAQKTAMAQVLEGQVLPLSLQMYGCRVVQKALECVLVDQQVRFVRELEGHVWQCARDAHAVYVVQRALERVPPEHLHFIANSCIGHVHGLATHPRGSHLLESIFHHCPPHQTRALLDELHRYTQQLIQDQYGNYVIQWVIEKGETPDRSHVISIIYGQVLPLAQHQHASNVVEKCIIHGLEEERRRIIDELLVPVADGSSVIKTMLAGAFSNYVVQHALYWSTGAQREAIYLETARQLPHLRKHSTDPQYLVNVEKLLQNERCRKAIS